MIPVTAHRRGVVNAALGVVLLLVTGTAVAAPAGSRVEEVPSRPAFVRLPDTPERPARAGQTLVNRSVLRTQTPGCLQVRLGDGRRFRLGGDSLLRLSGGGLDLLRGKIIAWLTPAGRSGGPLRLRTRVATASIEGTTVFVDASPDTVKIFSWEGDVQVTTATGERFVLASGEQLEWSEGRWRKPRRLGRAEAAERRRVSPLLNGFSSPMDTLPEIEKELGLSPGR